MTEYSNRGPANDNSGASEFCEFSEFESGSREFSVVCDLTLLTNHQGIATKFLDIGVDGKLRKTSAANIYEGEAERTAVEGMKGLLDLIKELQPNQAFCFGIAEPHKARLLTQESLRTGAYPGAIARDQNHFSFKEGQPGIMMLDYDPRDGQPALDWQELDRIICEIIPSFPEAQRLWRPSSSAFIYKKDGTELIGKGGWRCYAMADDAGAIPGVGAFLYLELWKRGHGYIKISKSGQALDRSLVDASVWQGERIDFAAEPVLGDGLERRAPSPVLLGSAPLLKTNGIIAPMTLPEWREQSEELRKAKEAVRPQARKVREAYIAKRMEALDGQLPGKNKKLSEKVIRQAVEQQVLAANFELHRPDGTAVTVGEVLADPDKWNQCRFADPLEPDYHEDSRIAFVALDPESGEDPCLFSHAHGGSHYRLVRQTTKIALRKGDRPGVVDASLALLRDRGEFYERGGEMVRVAQDQIFPITDPYLSDNLGRHIRFFERRFRNGQAIEEPADPPNWLCQQINAKKGERGLRELKGILTAPTLRPDGSLLNTPGFDEETGLLLRSGAWPAVPDNPTEEEIEGAFNVLWKPFADFPFVGNHDRGVMVAAILTAVVRATLPSAPAFSFDAPVAATGKTLLALCAQRICGSPPCVIPECRDEEELRKRLLAKLREGKPTILLDNIRGAFGSAALEAFLTCPTYSDRVLGQSQILALPTNMLVLISGNNFRPKGDLFRRILTLRIDAHTEAPERRSFALKPDDHCRLYRQDIVASALTILRGFVASGKPRTTKDRLASFEDWDDLIRQAVLWLGKRQHLNLGDPTACIEAAKEQEPERQKLAALLTSVAAIFKASSWRVADLIERANRSPCDPLLLTPDEKVFAGLRSALEEIAGERGKINSRMLGRWIENHKDIRCAGFFLSRVGTKQNAVLWTLERYGEDSRTDGK